MTDTRRLIEQVGERAPFPSDAFERMLRRRDRKQRNQRIAAAAVGIAVFAAVVALALGSFDRTAIVPGSSPTETGTVFTFFGPEGMVSMNGVRIKTTSNHPPSPPGTPRGELDYRYVLDPVIDVPAGARFEVGEPGARAWVDAFDLSEPAQRLYEVDLAASPSMPEEPGTYYLEFEIGDTGGPLTFLVPIRVVAPEEMGLAFSFDPYDVNHMVYVNGVPLPGEMNGGETTDGSGQHPFYIFAPGRRIDVPAGARIKVEGANVLDDFADEPHAWIDACCDTSTPPSRLYALELGGSASMPAEPGRYFLEIRWTCETCEPDAGVMFLFPVRVAAP